MKINYKLYIGLLIEFLKTKKQFYSSQSRQLKMSAREKRIYPEANSIIQLRKYLIYYFNVFVLGKITGTMYYTTHQSNFCLERNVTYREARY